MKNKIDFYKSNFTTTNKIGMKKIYYLKTCTTSLRIIKQLQEIVSEKSFREFIFQDIKTAPITVAQLEEMFEMTRSYEALFSRRAKKYHQMGLKSQSLSEKDYKRLLLDEYTFLKRPVIIINKHIFVGSSKKNVELLLEFIQK